MFEVLCYFIFSYTLKYVVMLVRGRSCVVVLKFKTFSVQYSRQEFWFYNFIIGHPLFCQAYVCRFEIEVPASACKRLQRYNAVLPCDNPNKMQVVSLTAHTAASIVSLATFWMHVMLLAVGLSMKG